MSAVFNAIGDAVEFVGDTVGDVVDNALSDPIGTIAKVAAVSTGQFELLPVISAATTVANGGDLTDAVKAGAITYAAGTVGGWAGDEVSAATNYGTELGSQQTAMLAAQDAGMGASNLAGGLTKAVVGSGTGAALSGGDVNQAILGGLAGYGTGLTLNGLGQVINSAGDVISDSYDQFIAEQNQTADQPGDYPLNAEELAAADQELSTIPDYQPTYGDQEGDYPLTQDELAATDYTMDQTADQPGDYDTTAEEVAASEEQLANMPGASSDTDVTGALKNYATNVFKNQLVNNLLRGTPSYNLTRFTTPTTPVTPPIKKTPYGLTASGKNTVASNLLGGLSGFGMDYGFGDYTSEDTGVTGSTIPRTAISSADAQLFNPLAGMSWAPQTKIGGLGAAGKYINQEQDTYYVNPEQAKKEQNYYNQGWTAEGEKPLRPEDQLYFDYTDTNLVPQESIQTAAEGGLIDHNPEFYSEGGVSMANRYVKGEGDGTSDSVPAMLASGEFVIPADVVSSLGNGDNDAGALTLDEFLKVIRKHKRSAHPSELPEDSKGPLAYLQEALTKVKK